MASIPGNRLSISAKPSPLEGPASYYGQSATIDLKKLSRREWWLWFSGLTVTLLAAVVLTLTAFSRLFKHKDHFYEITPEQARWGILCLLLLFNGWMLYRQRSFRKLRKEATAPGAGNEDNGAAVDDTAAVDPVTGLRTRQEKQCGAEPGDHPSRRLGRPNPAIWKDRRGSGVEGVRAAVERSKPWHGLCRAAGQRRLRDRPAEVQRRRSNARPEPHGLD